MKTHTTIVESDDSTEDWSGAEKEIVALETLLEARGGLNPLERRLTRAVIHLARALRALRTPAAMLNGHVPGVEHLTPRERQVLGLIASGGTNKEVAGKLAISSRTVEIHRSAIMNKLGARNAVGLMHVLLGAASSKPVRHQVDLDLDEIRDLLLARIADRPPPSAPHTRTKAKAITRGARSGRYWAAGPGKARRR
jgi:DNA-binding CsgD family transcriptional regulator